MTFADRVIDYTLSLTPDWKLPKGIDILYPYSDDECKTIFTTFYKRYCDDNHKRIILLGINPGRFGSGITGVPFTDPSTIEKLTGVKNSYTKKTELSSQFIMSMINAMGGAESFFQHYFIGSVCPLGFMRDNKNCNYYDDPKLYQALKPIIVDAINKQIEFGVRTDIAFSIGQGENFKILKELNDDHQFFDRIEPLPHPRWVMQYRKKDLTSHIDTYVTKLSEHLTV
jgi:hypothetical protein